MTAAVLSTKEIVCPMCYLAHRLILFTEPRIPATGMLWLCDECKDISVFDENLDLRMATDEEKSKAIRPTALNRS
jgi:hypothetical protein